MCPVLDCGQNEKRIGRMFEGFELFLVVKVEPCYSYCERVCCCHHSFFLYCVTLQYQYWQLPIVFLRGTISPIFFTLPERYSRRTTMSTPPHRGPQHLRLPALRCTIHNNPAPSTHTIQITKRVSFWRGFLPIPLPRSRKNVDNFSRIFIFRRTIRERFVSLVKHYQFSSTWCFAAGT